MFKGADFRNFCRFLCSLCGAIFSAVGVLQNAAAYSCAPGQYVNQNGGCTECPAGCWCVPGQNAATTTVANVANMCSPSSTTYTGRTYGGENLGGGAFKCPAGFSYSSASSDSATDCYGSVGAGYYIHSSGFKSASTDSCPVGSYCPGGKYYSGPNGGDQGVYACPNHSTTASQTSSSINQCICDSGYYMNGLNCISVGVDYYRIYPDNSRYACSANATTNGSTGASYCTCKTGYSGGGGTSDPSGANCVATNTGCATNQIDAGGTCQDVKFTVTTTQMTANDTFKWTMSAAGTFYVDCGDDGVLSGTGVSGKTIDRANNTSRQQYTCSYTNSGTHTIRFGGVATGYNSSTYSNYAAIRFGNISSNDGNTPTKIAGISGSLGAIFGTIGNGDTLSKQPRFAYTFFECTGLTGSIPENLFAGISGAPASYMFAVTFYGCSGLTGSIPETLFSGISGAPASYMFGSTFSGCSGLTGSIPENLFAGVEGAPADNMFSSTFAGCSGLTGSIPENLFAGISGAPASYMFGSTFSGCAGLTGSIPENLFAGVEGAPAQSMFSFTFSGCTGLTGSIPETLFSGISGAPASYMFGYTFNGCSGLTGSIPENLFAGISGAPANNMFGYTFYDCSNLTGFTDGTTTTSYVPESFLSSINTDTSVSNQVSSMFSGTGLSKPCPVNTYTVTRAQFDNAGKPWCAPCPDGTHYNGTGATSVNQCCPSGSDWNGTTCASTEYTITYNLNGGTGCSNTTYTDSATLCTPTRDGYIFAGWYDNVDLTGTAVATIPTGSTGNKEYWAKWEQAKFTLTTSATDSFQFVISAVGTFYVDCGNGGILSGNGVSGNTINRTNIYSATYMCSWNSSAPQTIRFGGAATGYNNTNSDIAAITFHAIANENINENKIIGISGSLGQIFGTVTNPSIGQSQPRFRSTFMSASNMLNTNIDDPNNPGKKYALPPNLFDGITGTPTERMFYGTFYGCSGLTGSIPENLFAGISGAPASTMFVGTFQNCSGLTGSIPSGLFSGITGAPAQSMFASTFSGCTGLTGSIPSGLFSGITGAPAQSMFFGTFQNCGGLTGSIPSGLFSGITGTPAKYMFNGTFQNCGGLTGSIPSGLFSGITGAPAEHMFRNTYHNCSGLTGFTDGTTTTSYVPASFLSSINTDMSVSNQVTGMFNGTGLANPCPANTYNVTPEQFNDAEKPWCAPCPTGTHYNGTGATSVNQCCPSGSDWDGTTCASIEYTITYNLNGGTGCSNTTYTDSATLCTPTRDGYIFNGWYDNVNLTGTAVTEIASGSTGNKEYWAKWEIANGYYLDNDIAVQCPVGYRDGPGANNIYMCYANGATSCSAYLSFDSANVNYATSDVSLPCKRYYGTDRCVPDNLAACNISSFSCLSNYDTVAWNFESLTTPNSFAVKKASRGECYWMDVNSSLEDCDNPVFSDMAPGDWKWEYPDKTFYGVARCSATAGTNFASGNPDFTNTGDNCWCRIEKINDQTAVSSWFNLSAGGCSNCANACGIAAFVSSDYVNAITGTLTQQCVAPSTISLSYTDELDDTIYDGPNSCTINDTFTLPPAPTKTGYTFTGWTLVEN